MFIDKMTLEHLRDTYTKGTQVRLVSMDDPQAPPKNTLGIVSHVDDAGSIHVHWETGSSLAVIYGEDIIEKV